MRFAKPDYTKRFNFTQPNPPELYKWSYVPGKQNIFIQQQAFLNYSCGRRNKQDRYYLPSLGIVSYFVCQTTLHIWA